MSIKEAKKARENAYAPYSNFKVGAAVKLKDGTFIHGANVENASFGLCNCAERSAIFSLISQGFNHDDIESITVIGDTKGPISPCGACRQVLYELLPDDALIVLANMQDETMTMTKDEILPYGFDLKKDRK